MTTILVSFGARNDAIVIRGVHDVATRYICFETRKLEGKLDALVNLLTRLAANRSCLCCKSLRGVHDVATDTSTKTRKLEGRLDAIVNLVTQLAANQKPASVVRVCGIRSSNDHHPSTSTVAETRHLIEKIGPNYYKFSARIDAIVIRGVHDVATDTSAETRKLEGKLDALLNLVTSCEAGLPLLQV
ncbi:hypothetical protein Fmac_028591 [Flemingia macrophylla]|uniref:Uncharacterized protein n=1 Tax=Flemingia macrophylla TaxID=520843 RepID=A0ABD1L7Y3_9FABA